MKFRDTHREAQKTIEQVCLILSLGVIFIQIWILATTLEAYFQGKTQHLVASVVLSLIAFAVAALSAWTMGMNVMKGMDEGRTQTYHKHNEFRN